MFKKKALCGLTLSLLASGAVFADSDNTINFIGEVTDQTCEIAVNGNTGSSTVLLPSVAASVLGSDGATAGKTSFTLDVSNCNASDSGSIKTNTAFVATNPDDNGNLTNTGEAENVALQLLDSDGVKIDFTSSSYQSVTGAEIAQGETSGSVEYGVQYVATGAATAGSVLGSVQYAITYE